MFKNHENQFSTVEYPSVVNDCFNLAPSTLGLFDPQTLEIRIVDGLNSHVVRHELSHFFTYYLMRFHQFYESEHPINAQLYHAMDEAFAEYWLSIGINSTNHNYGTPTDILSCYVDTIHRLYNPQSLTLDETFYSWYDNRYPIASAWWTLRENPLFGEPDPTTQVTAFDNILLSVLMSDVSIADSLRYMPRYFYNLLMTKVGETNQHSLNAMQIAIDKAYSARGLHFTPQVISAGVSNPPEGRDKSMFRIGDPVHVKVTNCPQNTPLTVYIVEDQDYTDGMNISALNTFIC